METSHCAAGTRKDKIGSIRGIGHKNLKEMKDRGMEDEIR
jgi:hypothetical protein